MHEKGGLIAFRSVHSIFKNHILALCCILFSLIITQSQTWFLIYWHLLNSWSMGVDYAGRVLCTSSRHARVKFPVWKYSNDSNLQILVRQLLNCEISLRQKYVLSRLSCQMVNITEWVPVYTGQMSWLSHKSRWNLKPHDDKYILIIVNEIEMFCNSTVAIYHHNLCYTLCWKNYHIFSDCSVLHVFHRLDK